MPYRSNHKITVYKTPNTEYFFGFRTKKEAEMAKGMLRKVREEHPDGRELGTFSDREAFKRFGRHRNN